MFLTIVSQGCRLFSFMCISRVFGAPVKSCGLLKKWGTGKIMWASQKIVSLPSKNSHD